MPLNVPVNGGTVFATDVSQLTNIFQALSGAQEKGGYYLNGWGNAASDQIGAWVPSRSYFSTPVSVSLDTSVQAATNCAAPSTNSLTVNGFHASTTSTAANTAMYVGGVYTIQY